MTIHHLLDPVPICPNHGASMLENPSLDGYACPVLDCTQCYTAVRGHFQTIQGKIPTPTNKKPCVECSAPLYLAKRGKITLEDVYLCPNPMCPAKK